MRKAALRQITDKAREFGAGPLFNQILPLLMSPTLEDQVRVAPISSPFCCSKPQPHCKLTAKLLPFQERHLLVKVIDRILYKLDDLVRPFVHKVCWIFQSVVWWIPWLCLLGSCVAVNPGDESISLSDSCGHWTPADWWRLLCQGGRKRNHLQLGKGEPHFTPRGQTNSFRNNLCLGRVSQDSWVHYL